ncbi:GyrI-like domain-containing protein [Limosilactobacillus sp. Sa3CUN2]|uniref:GyrI-like domain-containing protein n=1 Tax=Limosilactobacillus avistercoris TaxID=2762243 RepID=A0ABR8PAG2_9LACO|nr:GyrI-like domain-containing protein [Limosilactobacillus avistercoris]MBD7894232.1 GyrI-like domain-containing protein [Limosilactobacillus avistercoris]
MVYDFKREERYFYLPGKRVKLVDIPKMTYLAVSGHGDPNVEGSEYKRAIAALYAVAYTTKMSKKGDHKIKDYFDFVVPPLEGLWWQDGVTDGIDYGHKKKFQFIALIRMPDFVNQAVLKWAIQEASHKKKQDFTNVKLLQVNEGKYVQVMHVGSYDDEPQTIAKMHQFITKNKLETDFNSKRRHHEIYLSDPRRTKVENLKTVIRIPVKVKE